MELKSIVLHQIKRENNDAPVLNCSDHLLNIKDKTVIEFVEKLIKSFSSKNPTYGVFQDEEDAYPFQKLVKDYIKNEGFLDFSIEAMKLLEKEIQVPQAKGGYVVFTHYSHNKIEFLITIMLDKSEQFTINDDSLDIRKLLTLDVDRLARANRLNISKWQNDDDLYLAFIKGTRDVSGYFQKFIGNTDLTSSKKNSRNLKEALSKYMRDKGFSDERKQTVNQNISGYFERQFREDLDIQLEAISAHTDQDNPLDFINYLNESGDFEVSGSFRVAKKADFNVFYRSIVSGRGFKLEFERNLVRNGKILREGNDVIIKDVAEDILDKEFDN